MVAGFACADAGVRIAALPKRAAGIHRFLPRPSKCLRFDSDPMISEVREVVAVRYPLGQCRPALARHHEEVLPGRRVPPRLPARR
jgi:hypothetical protein